MLAVLRPKPDLAQLAGIALWIVAALLIFAFDGSMTPLIQLYILGVFTSFTLCQAGMVRHWNRVLAATTDVRDLQPVRPLPGDLRRGVTAQRGNRR